MQKKFILMATIIVGYNGESDYTPIKTFETLEEAVEYVKKTKEEAKTDKQKIESRLWFGSAGHWIYWGKPMIVEGVIFDE